MQINSRFLTVLSRLRTIECTLYQVLQRRRTRAVAILMEKQQTLRQFTVVHVIQQITNGVLTLFASQLRTKSKLIFMRQEILNKRRLNTILQILEQILEHAAGCSRSRNELKDLMSLSQVLLPSGDILLLLRTFRSQDTLLRRSGSHDV